MIEDQYESFEETDHLLKSTANASCFLRSINEADQGKLAKCKLIKPTKAPPAAG